jgi:hypothetical protein
LNGALDVQQKLTEIRQITDRNARGVKETLAGSSGLLKTALQVGKVIDHLSTW